MMHTAKKKETAKKSLAEQIREAVGTTTTKCHTRTAKKVLQERRFQEGSSAQIASSLDHRSKVLIPKKV
jgi:hypothetical protein